MADTQKLSKREEKCGGCIFWRPLAGGWNASGKACHHYLDTGIRREEGEDGVCRSKTTDPLPEKKGSERWPYEPQYGTVYDGYKR